VQDEALFGTVLEGFDYADSERCGGEGFRQVGESVLVRHLGLFVGS